MTTSNTTGKTAQIQGRFRLPDPPEDPEDKMTSFDHLAATGNAHHLAVHLGNPETTLVAGEHYLVVRPTWNLSGSRYPDLLVAFGVDPAAYKASNGYVISEQGKPPDFVLEIASRSTGRVDVTDKRRDYAALGIPEYWRFDETGEYHGERLSGERLSGERLVDGVYVGVEIEELPDGSLQGYSGSLDLHLRWEQGKLAWYDPATGRRIATFEDERARADTAESRAAAAESRADAAESRVRELEEQVRRQGS